MILSATGHRPNKLGGYTKQVEDRLFHLAVEHIQLLDPELVISGMALGWDMAVAEAAYCLDIPFHAYVPFRGQESKWPAASQQFYLKLIAQAAKVVECAEPGYAVWKMQNRNECMVQASDKILALWDGSEGGTGNCVNYATRVGREIINLWEYYVN